LAAQQTFLIGMLVWNLK